MLHVKKEKNMKVNSISGTSFKGLLVIKDLNSPQKQAVNTDYIKKIKDISTENSPCASIILDGSSNSIHVKSPFEDVVSAYQRAASTSSSTEELQCNGFGYYQQDSYGFYPDN